MSETPLLRLEEALAAILTGADPLPAEAVSIGEGSGRVLAEPVAARLTLPPWPNSAMDGFAVRAADVAAASAMMPVTLPITGEIAAGHLPERPLAPGTAVRILTGAVIPEGADAVVPVEETDAPAGVAALPDRVAILAAPRPGAHIRAAGGDVRAGEVLLTAGARLSPAAIGAIAAAGIVEVPVIRRPRVAVLSTGDELVPIGAPVDGARIPDSNGVQLAAQVRSAGALPLPLGIVADEPGILRQRLAEAIAGADVVISSGGVSVGAHDEVRLAFAALGQVDLWRVAIQPGKPLAFGRARRPDGATTLLFGLPGNPVSAFVTFELFVRPLLRRLGGLPVDDGRDRIRAILAEPVTKSAGRRAFLRVVLERDPGGSLPSARLAGGQGSHILSALALADGLAIIPEETDRLAAGEVVEVLLLDRGAA